MGLSLYAKWITFDPDPFSVSTTLKMYEFLKKIFLVNTDIFFKKFIKCDVLFLIVVFRKKQETNFRCRVP